VVGELAAVLVIFTLPLSISAFVGAKVTSSVALWPGAIVAPLTPPFVVMLAPKTLNPETVRLEFPVFSIFTARVSDFPAITLPKFRPAGDAEIVLESATPVAVNATVALPAGVSAKVTLPLAEPSDVAVKLSVQFNVCPAARVIGKLKLQSLNSDPAFFVTPVSVIALLLVFFNCSLCETLVPMGTLPKFAVPGVIVNAPGVPTPKSV
jgi:hypothetical protein